MNHPNFTCCSSLARCGRLRCTFSEESEFSRPDTRQSRRGRPIRGKPRTFHLCGSRRPAGRTSMARSHLNSLRFSPIPKRTGSGRLSTYPQNPRPGLQRQLSDLGSSITPPGHSAIVTQISWTSTRGSLNRGRSIEKQNHLRRTGPLRMVRRRAHYGGRLHVHVLLLPSYIVAPWYNNWYSQYYECHQI